VDVARQFGAAGIFHFAERLLGWAIAIGSARLNMSVTALLFCGKSLPVDITLED